MHRESSPIVLSAHAKVNLFLAVGARRPDGYHDVTTVLQALELADEVRVAHAGPGIELVCEPDPGVPPEQNLAYRAAAGWFEAVGADPAVGISITKRIPAGAGLGGGSADAAAVLAALSDLEPGALAPDRVALLAASLGADVPFFLGAGTQLLSGRGDLLVDSLPAMRLDIVLANPGVPVSTGEAYARFDRLLRVEPPSPDAMVAALRAGDPEAVAAALYDNMTEASCALVPEIAPALRFVRDFPGVLGAEMAGSGSTVFGVCTDAASARACAAAAAERGWWSCATRSATAGVTAADGRTDQGVLE